MRSILVVFLLFLIGSTAVAQITPVSLSDRAEEASLIVEAEVLDSRAFWGSKGENIYTSHLLKLYKVFKGSIAGGEIEILTMGGVVGLQGQHTSHVLKLSPGDIGVFLCKPTSVSGSGRGLGTDAVMEAVAAQQGFLRYQIPEQTAADPFNSYGDFETQLYPRITSLTGQPWTVKQERVTNAKAGSFHKGGGMGIAAGMSITTVTGPHPAGNRTVLTITGKKFGAGGGGVVRFISADDNTGNYISALPLEIISWTNTQIQVYVPPDAGTGPVRVVNAAANDSATSATLTIPYSRLAAEYNGSNFTTDHVDDNGNGGYTWRMNSTFAGDAARRTAFVDQLEAWHCATTTNRVNWDVGSNTALSTIASDGVNLAMMGGLPSGVLGRCTSRWYISSCAPDTVVWLYELDIAFSTTYNWEYTGTPASGVYDFRSVALHELGHGMQLGHAKNSAQVMYYAMSSGTTKRTLHTNDIAGAQNAMDASVASNPCGGSPSLSVSANAGPDISMCSGGSAILSAQGGATYAWTIPPATTVLSTEPTYTVAPASTTTYRVSVTNGSCHTSTDDVTVTVRSIPTANAGADVGICPSGSASIGSTGVSPTNYTSTGSGTAVYTGIMFMTGSQDNRTQLLFTATELSALGFSQGIITDIAFSIASANTATQAMNGFNVRLAHTTATSLSTGFQTETFTTVYSSVAYTPSGTGWQNLDLTPWFYWDGLSNLLVEVCFDNSTATTDYALDFTTHSSYLSAYNYDTGSGCSLPSQWINDVRPLTRFTVASEGYLWSPVTGLSSPYIANPTASPSASTTYTVTVTTEYGCTDTDQVTVTMHPADPTSLTWTGAVNTDWGTLGNWDSPCAVPSTGDAVTIPTATTPPTNVPAITLSSLSIDNSSGVTLGNSVTVNGTLTLTDGAITIGNNNLTVGSSGSISGGGSSSHIVTNGSGMLIQDNIGSTGRSGSVLFPVATATTYTPVTLLNAGSNDAFRVRVAEGVLDGGTSGAPLTSHAVGKTWTIEEASPGGSDATVTLQWNSGDELSLFDRTNSYVAKHTGSAWTALQAPAAASGSDPYTRSASGIISFSPFGIGDNNSPLPVELTAFHARLAGSTVQLSWTTATELNNYGFAVERRIAGGSWTEIGFVAGNGTRLTPSLYGFVDMQLPEAEHWYYRLRQMDRDGAVTFGPEIEIARSTPQKFTLSAAWPQPASKFATMRIHMPEPEQLTVRIVDLHGAVVHTAYNATTDAGEHLIRSDVSNLRSGTYFIIATSGARLQRTRLVILR